VIGVGNDYDTATRRTVPAGQTSVHQYLTTAGDTFWLQHQTNTTPTAGTVVTINDTAPTDICSGGPELQSCQLLPCDAIVTSAGCAGGGYAKAYSQSKESHTIAVSLQIVSA
jgi:hypothetical protein